MEKIAKTLAFLDAIYHSIPEDERSSVIGLKILEAHVMLFQGISEHKIALLELIKKGE